MNRLSICLSIVTLSFLCLPSNSHAAIVTFSGVLTSGSGVLGDVPPPSPFSIMLDFTENSPGFATINSGLFSSPPGSINISGGDILLIENGTNDQGLFAINTSGPTGSLSVTFLADAITDNQVTTQNLVDLVNAAAPSTISANFGASGNYTGSVTSAVPEPSSLLLLGGCTGLAIFRRRRRMTT